MRSLHKQGCPLNSTSGWDNPTHYLDHRRFLKFIYSDFLWLNRSHYATCLSRRQQCWECPSSTTNSMEFTLTSQGILAYALIWWINETWMSPWKTQQHSKCVKCFQTSKQSNLNNAGWLMLNSVCWFFKKPWKRKEVGQLTKSMHMWHELDNVLASYLLNLWNPCTHPSRSVLFASWRSFVGDCFRPYMYCP